ncbi:MAG: ion channel [Bacteroidota bacterium]
MSENNPGSSLQEDRFKDLGFGTEISAKASRLLTKEGDLNVRRVGNRLKDFHLYQYLISIKWWQFWVYLLLFYICFNAFFACLYVLAGIESLNGITPHGDWLEDFRRAFFFSTQTFTTVGYGVISPKGLTANLIASFEAMTGLIGFAFATGLLYGRFAQPTARILFSEQAVMAPYRDIRGLMFRIVNGRRNQLINLEAKIIASWFEEGGDRLRRNYHLLELERDQVSLFPLSWTLVHPVDENSPLADLTYEQLLAAHAEFLVIIQGYDESFAQTVHARTSYTAEELLWGAAFNRMFYTDEEGRTVIDIERLSETRVEKLD